LAAFRELQDFARMGTELDSTAQAQLDRGNRMVELLKQPQFSPQTVGEQVITIFAGASGQLDDVPVNEVSQFMTLLLQHLMVQHREYIDEINKTGKFSDELAQKVTAAIKTYKETRQQKT